jgi:hypothetical protein
MFAELQNSTQQQSSEILVHHVSSLMLAELQNSTQQQSSQIAKGKYSSRSCSHQNPLCIYPDADTLAPVLKKNRPPLASNPSGN